MLVPTRRRVSRGVRVCPAAAAAAAAAERTSLTRAHWSRGRGTGAAAHPAGTPDSASRAGAVHPDAARAREGSWRPVASEKSGGRRVRQKTCPRSATQSSGSRVRRKTRSPPRATLRGRDANARATARAPKKDPFASSIAIATQDFDVARERRARGATFRGRRRGEKGVVVRTGKKRESVRRRNSASDRAPRLRRRPSSARRPRSLKRKNFEEDFIANGDLGRAVKDALRVCKWKTRVAFLIILLSLARVCLSDSQTTRSWTRLRSTRRIPTPNQTLLHASEKQRQAEATRGLAGCSARFGPRRRAGRRSGAVPRRTPRRESRPKRGVLGGNTARRARVSSVARSYSPSRAPDPLGGSPRVPNRRDVRGVRGSTGVESILRFSLLSRGKQSPWDGVDAHPRRKKRREMIVGCPPERTPRVRGVPRLTRRRWARF